MHQYWHFSNGADGGKQLKKRLIRPLPRQQSPRRIQKTGNKLQFFYSNVLLINISSRWKDTSYKGKVFLPISAAEDKVCLDMDPEFERIYSIAFQMAGGDQGWGKRCEGNFANDIHAVNVFIVIKRGDYMEKRYFYYIAYVHLI